MDEDAYRQPAAWLLALSGAILYVWAPSTVPADALAGEPALPAWLGLVAPPVLYGLLMAGFPRVPLARRLGGVAALCLGHALLTFATPLFYEATGFLPSARAETPALWAYPAAALVQLLAVPLVAFPLRGLLARPRGRRRRRGGARMPTPAPIRLAPAWDDDVKRTVGGDRLREEVTGREVTPEWRRATPPRPGVARTPTPPPAAPTAKPVEAAPQPTTRRGLFEVVAAPDAPAPAPRAPTAPTASAAPTVARVTVAPALDAQARAPLVLDDAGAPPAAEPTRAPGAPSLPAAAEPPVAPAPFVRAPVPVAEPRRAVPVSPAPAEPLAAVESAERDARPVPPAAPPEPAAAPPVPAIAAASAEPTPVAEPLAAEAGPASEHAGDLQRVATLLRRVGPMDAGVQTLMGITLFTLCSPRLAREAVVQSAFRFLSFAAGGTHPLSQATLRGTNGAMVLTPLAPLHAGGPVIVAAVARRGALALLEILCRSAAAEYRGTHGTVGPPPAARDAPAGEAGELAEAAVPPRLLTLARSLGACGPVAPRALQDRAGRVCLYLLVPTDIDGIELGRLARDLYEAMGSEEDQGGVGPVQCLVLRLGSRRVIVTPVSAAPSGSTLLVAGGGQERPGLAQREVERVAARLAAAS